MQSRQGPVDVYLGHHTIPPLLAKIFMATSQGTQITMNRKVLMCLLRTAGTPGSEMVLFTSVTGQIRSGMALLKGVMREYVESTPK